MIIYAHSYPRAAAVAIAIYEELRTIPAEVSIYSDQTSFRKMSHGCILFILIRYVSILAVIVESIGYFDHSFTEASCQKYFRVSTVIKVVQNVVSNIILGVRTYALSRNARWVMWTLGILFILGTGFEAFVNVYHVIPIRLPPDSPRTNCTSGNEPRFRAVWMHYAVAIFYDTVCLVISTSYIYNQCRDLPLDMHCLSRKLFKEGIMYFCFLTASNIVNLVFYATSSQEVQSSASALGYVITWVLSQGLLIHLHEHKTMRTESYSRDEDEHSLAFAQPSLPSRHDEFDIERRVRDPNDAISKTTEEYELKDIKIINGSHHVLPMMMPIPQSPRVSGERKVQDSAGGTRVS